MPATVYVLLWQLLIYVELKKNFITRVSVPSSVMCNWPPILRMLHYGTTPKSQLTWYILWPDVTRFFPKNANHINYRCKKDKGRKDRIFRKERSVSKWNKETLTCNITSFSNKITIWTPTLIMHLLVFFSPLVESLILFFTQLICRVVKIIPFVFHFSDLLSRSFRSRSLIQKSKKFKDKPCGNNAAYGAA